MIGIDSNFLIACQLPEHLQHLAVRKVLNQIVDEGERFAIAPQVLAEFVHIVTDGRRVQVPHTMEQALAEADLWRTAVDVDLLAPSADAVELFFQWMRQFRLGRKRVLDTLLAATYAVAGVDKIATIDVGDFQVFGCFELIAPSSPA